MVFKVIHISLLTLLCYFKVRIKILCTFRICYVFVVMFNATFLLLGLYYGEHIWHYILIEPFCLSAFYCFVTSVNNQCILVTYRAKVISDCYFSCKHRINLANGSLTCYKWLCRTKPIDLVTALSDSLILLHPKTISIQKPIQFPAS